MRDCRVGVIGAMRRCKVANILTVMTMGKDRGNAFIWRQEGYGHILKAYDGVEATTHCAVKYADLPIAIHIFAGSWMVYPAT